MGRGRPIRELTLAAQERETLEQWSRRPKTAPALAEEIGTVKQTVGKWRSRFLAQRLDGLLDEPRPGTPRKVSDQQVEKVVRMTLESAPRDATHWSTRSWHAAVG